MSLVSLFLGTNAMQLLVNSKFLLIPSNLQIFYVYYCHNRVFAKQNEILNQPN